MIHITKNKLNEKTIDDYIKNNLQNISRNKNFKLFALDDKNIGPDAFDKLELIAHPDNCNLLFIKILIYHLKLFVSNYFR